MYSASIPAMAQIARSRHSGHCQCGVPSSTSQACSVRQHRAESASCTRLYAGAANWRGTPYSASHMTYAIRAFWIALLASVIDRARCSYLVLIGYAASATAAITSAKVCCRSDRRRIVLGRWCSGAATDLGRMRQSVALPRRCLDPARIVRALAGDQSRRERGSRAGPHWRCARTAPSRATRSMVFAPV